MPQNVRQRAIQPAQTNCATANTVMSSTSAVLNNAIAIQITAHLINSGNKCIGSSIVMIRPNPNQCRPYLPIRKVTSRTY